MAEVLMLPPLTMVLMESCTFMDSNFAASSLMADAVEDEEAVNGAAEQQAAAEAADVAACTCADAADLLFDRVDELCGGSSSVRV